MCGGSLAARDATRTSSGWSANAALWAEMRCPVHGRPPTFAEHRDGVIVGVKSGALT
jgi:hypothetical protein